jgi:undecaprenyl diphosphate synthase
MNTIKSIGFILDGNRRYGVKKNIHFNEAYSLSAKKAISVIKHIYKNHKQIKQIHLFTLSKENVLNRSKKELDQLFNLFKNNKNQLEELKKYDINIKYIGNLNLLPKNFKKELPKNNNLKKRLTVYLCLAYGGRQEIIDAANKIIKKKVKRINEKTFKKYLYDENIVDPDIIVRTSGTKRLSGFMLYHSAYSELCFINKLWPEITNKDVDKIIFNFNKVSKNYGA